MCAFPIRDKKQFFLIFLYTNSMSYKCLPKLSGTSLWRVSAGYNLPFFLALDLNFRRKLVSLERV